MIIGDVLTVAKTARTSGPPLSGEAGSGTKRSGRKAIGFSLLSVTACCGAMVSGPEGSAMSPHSELIGAVPPATTRAWLKTFIACGSRCAVPDPALPSGDC